VDDRVETGQVEARAVDLRVLELPGGGRVAEIRLIPGGLLGTGRAGVAAELGLLAVPHEGGERVALGDLTVQLDVLRLERGLVAEVVDRLEIDLGAGVGAPNPQAVVDDGTAEFEAPVGDLIDAVALRERGLRVIVVPRAGLA